MRGRRCYFGVDQFVSSNLNCLYQSKTAASRMCIYLSPTVTELIGTTGTRIFQDRDTSIAAGEPSSNNRNQRKLTGARIYLCYGSS